jgi:hypothetical protein
MLVVCHVLISLYIAVVWPGFKVYTMPPAANKPAAVTFGFNDPAALNAALTNFDIHILSQIQNYTIILSLLLIFA